VGRDGERYIADLGQAKTEIFLQMGLDSESQQIGLICPSGRSADVRETKPSVAVTFVPGSRFDLSGLGATMFAVVIARSEATGL
jgi:hypothetical protein